MKTIFLRKGDSWLDAGSHFSLIQTGQYVQTIEERQDIKIACPEEIAWNNGWIDNDKLHQLANKLITNDYGKYLKKILDTQR